MSEIAATTEENMGARAGAGASLLSTQAVTHDFLGRHHERHARRTLAVLLLCAGTMVLEIVCGLLFNSMALLADGLHMATHAGVMLVAAGAYRFARARLRDPSYSFGTGKVGDLAAFASAIMLAATAFTIGLESVERLFSPVPIAFGEAIPVAMVGLLVNIISIWLLHDSDHHHDHGHDHHHAAQVAHAGHGHEHDHGHDHHHDHGDQGHAHDHDHGHDHEAHGHDHAHHHHDHNFRAAYLHVLADVAVGVLAIGGLVAGRYTGWLWLDPVIGLVGAYVVGRWAFSLLRASGNVLLDRVPDAGLAQAVRDRLERGGAAVRDFHLWRLGPGHHGVVAALSARDPLPPSAYRAMLAPFPTLSHIIIEVEPAEDARG